MMNLLLCGLNSYLGRSALSCLPDDEHRVFGLIRDVDLLKRNLDNNVNATIFSIDLIRKGKTFDDFHTEGLDLSIYFSQIPNQRDQLGVQYELLSLRNFIFLSQRDGCNRIVYVGGTHDQTYLGAVEALFEEMEVEYTILLKGLAVGKGSSFDRFMDEVLKNRLIYLYARLGRIKFKPIILSDFFSFIKQVNWQNNFINQCIEFGGERLMSVNELIRWYIKMRGDQMNYKVFAIPSKRLSIWLNKLLYGIDGEVYNDYLLAIMEGQGAGNPPRQREIDFVTLPIEQRV